VALDYRVLVNARQGRMPAGHGEIVHSGDFRRP
jgi:hypothetical protein